MEVKIKIIEGGAKGNLSNKDIKESISDLSNKNVKW